MRANSNVTSGFLLAKAGGAARAQPQREVEVVRDTALQEGVGSYWLGRRSALLAEEEGLRRGWGWTCNLYLTRIFASDLRGLFPLPVCQEQQPSWTDDLPSCHLSGVGSAPNRSYSADGKGTEGHPLEDNWLKFR